MNSVMQLADLVVGRSYVNKKNRKPYTLTGFGFHSETFAYQVSYTDENGTTWNRPIGLFLLRFTPVEVPEKPAKEVDTFPAVVVVKKRKSEVPTVIEVLNRTYLLRHPDAQIHQRKKV